jgi:segregation and condensation protein B
MNRHQAECLLEAALLSASHPLALHTLQSLCCDYTELKEEILALLNDLRERWQERGLELLSLENGWRFRVKLSYSSYLLEVIGERTPKYSRAVMETLAMIAYKQPVTRGEIEQVRGVSVSTQVIQTLLERGWINIIGRKEVPGRPALYATTSQFLNDLGLNSLEELPSVSEVDLDDIISTGS